MALMHRTETFQKLANLISGVAPEKWSSLLSIYLFHDGAMKLKQYYKETPTSDWCSFNTGSVGFDIMDWWEAYHGFVEEAEGNKFKFAKAQLDHSGHLKMHLSYEVVDPLSDSDILQIAENLSANS